MVDRTTEERIGIEVNYEALKAFVDEAEGNGTNPSDILNWFMQHYLVVPPNSLMDLVYYPYKVE
jgi:hypothetical protein